MGQQAKGVDEFGPIVTVDWLRARLGSERLVVVDARPPRAYLQGHIAGARNSDVYALKLADSREATMGAWAERSIGELRRLGIRAGDHVIFYEDISGTTAARGVWMMDALGIGNAAILDGGWAAWRAANGEAGTGSPDAADPGDVVAAPDRSVLATADEILAALGGDPPGIRVVDTRAREEWDDGTIPTAIHLEWSETLNPDGTFLSLDELRRRFRWQGIDLQDERPVVTFCASGYRAAHAYVALRALGVPAMNYAPSWNEWSRRGDLPIVRPAAER